MGLSDRVTDHRDKLIEIELEIGEAEEPKLMSEVYRPTREEYDRHRGTHFPY